MIIAIPTTNGQLDPHFGHCAQFTLFDTAEDGTGIEQERAIDAPPHQPGLLPGWLAERGVNVIIAGGMGQRAIELFRQNEIEVFIGVKPAPVREVADAFLRGELEAEGNLCDH